MVDFGQKLDMFKSVCFSDFAAFSIFRETNSAIVAFSGILFGQSKSKIRDIFQRIVLSNYFMGRGSGGRFWSKARYVQMCVL